MQFLFPIRPGIFFPLNVFPGSYASLLSSLFSHLSLSSRSQRTMRNAHAVRRAEAFESPAPHYALESLSLSLRRERRAHLRDALDVHALPRNEVLAGELRA